MDDWGYYLAWAGVLAAVPLSAVGVDAILPDSLGWRDTGRLAFFWFMFCVWAVAFTFWEYGHRCEDRAVRKHIEWHRAGDGEED